MKRGPAKRSRILLKKIRLLRISLRPLYIVMYCKHSIILYTFFSKKIKLVTGGERRRVSVATELLSEPTFLLCDEITTGLDMFQALQLVKCLKGLRATGVLCTIHQPPTQVPSVLHRVLHHNPPQSYFE